jgi:hypothetical protein
MSTPFYDLASLVVVPSGYKSGKVYAQKPQTTDGQLAFTRASSATRVASNGLIEKVRTNQLLQSNNFSNAYWTKVNATITAGQSDPNGGTSAFKIDFASGANAYLGVFGLGAGLKTNSVFLRADSSVQIGFANGQNSNAVTLTTSWVRYQIAQTGILIGAGFQLDNYFGVTTPQLGITIYAFQAQLETGDIATDYIATTTAAVSVGPVSGLPRLDYLGSTCPRLLLEPQRTNVVTNSETFGASTGTTIVLNNTASPDGYVSADKLVEDTSTGVHITLIGGALGGSVDSSVYSVSVFAKAAGRTRLNMFDNNQASAGITNFDIANGVVISGGGKIENYGNGWYRCTIFPAKTNNTNSNVQIRLINSGTNVSYTGNGTSGVFLWGAQIEASAYATSYIPTLGASVTRAADSGCGKTGISSLIGQTEGTLFAEVDLTLGRNNTGAGNGMLEVLDSTRANAVTILKSATANQILIALRVNSVNTFITAGAYISGTNKIALAYKSGQTACYVNGILVNTSSLSFTFSASIDAVNVGAYTTNVIDDRISQALVFKTRLTNAQLAELTA